MKISLILSFLFITLSGYSQNITYKDVIGKWEQIDTAVTHRNYVVTYEFLDSTHLIWDINKEEMPPMFYAIKKKQESVRLLLNADGNFINDHSGEAHRVSLNNDTLIIYNCYFPLSNEIKLETITLVKKR